MSEFSALTKEQILSALPLHQFPQSTKRSKNQLLQHIETLTDDEKAILKRIADSHEAERSQKRRRVDSGRTRTARETLQRAADYFDTHADVDISKCFHVATSEEIKSCVRNFRDATSNAATRMGVCAVCARDLLWNEERLEVIPLSDVPNYKRLKPAQSHPSHTLYDECLLAAPGVSEVDGRIQINICGNCKKSLEGIKNIPPSLSLANNLWIGDVPWQLQVLTLPEQLLISLVYPRVFVMKLFPKSQRACTNSETLQSGMKGNVSTYELNIDAVADMIAGNMMPRPPRILASLIAVTFVGHGPLPKAWLKQTFGVRRFVILDALHWLKTNNPKYYGNIEIDHTQLDNLPVDDVPEELLTIIHHEPNTDVLSQEETGYVPENAATGTPDIIPLHHLGVQDMDLTKLSSNELMVWGLANLWNQDQEGGYVARHGTNFVRDIGGHNSIDEGTNNESKNLFEQAFPCLFPYGIGGIEATRPVSISFIEHIRWTLQYHDRRFRLHSSYPFYAYGLWIKRQALTSVHIEMKRKVFESNVALLNSITSEDLRKAAEEERQDLPPSNPAISFLKRSIKTSSIRVPGSDQRRIALRSKIRSTILSLAPPNLWITINPHDLDDPIAQIFAGSNIDMDNFSKVNGPNAQERAKTIAADPYAAAKFFHFLIKAILETLFGISVTDFKVTSTDGIFGRVSCYIGTVESQGRGTLHLHLLLFLKDAPSAGEMEQLLKTEEFRKKVTEFIKANIHAFIPGMSTTEEIFSEAVEPELAYSRPPNPDSPDFDAQFKKMEKNVARAQQVHSCQPKRCLRPDKHGVPKCKRRAPWEIAQEAYIHEDGSWCPKRLFAYFTGWAPAISVCGRCNNDIKVITNGTSTKKLTYYISCYSTKLQVPSFNMSALLADNLLHHFEGSEYRDNLLERNRLLLFRCLHVLNREQEISGPMVMSLLMGWDDIYVSHQYVPIYWSSFIGHLHRHYPELRCDGGKRLTSDENTEAGIHNSGIESADGQSERPEIGGITPEDNDDDVILELSPENNIRPKCQITDYQLRGYELEDYCVLDFFTDTYEERIKHNEASSQPSSSTTDSGSHSAKRGRKSNLRSKYLAGHPKQKTCQRVKRSHGHSTLPNICGRWFPSRDDEDIHEFYCASMLMLLCRWRSLSNLKEPNETWKSAYTRFLSNASPRILRIISNIQYYHDCETAAKMDHEDNDLPSGNNNQHSGHDSSVDEAIAFPEDASVEDEFQPVTREDLYTLEAIEVGRYKCIFTQPDLSWSGGLLNTNPALLEDIQDLYRWKQQLEQNGNPDVTVPTLPNQLQQIENMPGHSGYIIPEELYNLRINTVFNNEEVAEEALTSIDPSCLLPEQRRAYNIIIWHLNAVLQGKDPPQLLMQIQGEGGTGKSKVIQTITDFFEHKQSSKMLVKAAYTGIAASLINGKTTHNIGKINISQKKDMATETKKWLTAFWRDVKYLILDECSMISREFFAILEEHISIGKGFDENSGGGLPFGGVNVILCGDFHQFPPVACKKTAPLYYPIHPGKDSIQDKIGRQLYEAFKTVVVLERQVRVTDPDWLDFLRHLRAGNIKESHIPMIQKLCLTHPECPPTDFSRPPWSEAALVTPRHSVRKAWNFEMLKKHCRDRNLTLFMCPSQDTVNGRPLRSAERIALMNKKNGRRRKADMNNLPESIEMAVGMKVMVTANIDTDIDIANGSRGEVTKIVLDPREQLQEGSKDIVRLEYLPLYILVKLQRTRAAQLHGLEPGVIPILPAKKKITIRLRGADGQNVQRTVTRMQLPITPAYGFTDYRAQGQTLSHVIVDLAPPPTGSPLTQFNYYVALSRSSGCETIRLLREIDIRLLKQPQDSYLEQEDRRLRDLNEKTKEWWAIIAENR